jgi:hypothetical protein
VLRHWAGVRRRFEALERPLAEAEVLGRAHVGRVPCRLLSGQAFRDFMLPKLREDGTLLLAEGDNGQR